MSEENVRTVQDAYAAFGRGDIPALLTLLTDDVEWAIPGPPDVLPYAGTFRGREEVERFFTLLARAVEYEQFEARDFVAGGDGVVALGYEKGRARPTGRSFEGHWAMVFVVRAGRIAAFRSYEDTAATAEAFSTSSRTAQPA
jgi:ketosteroid isomerase-like protein